MTMKPSTGYDPYQVNAPQQDSTQDLPHDSHGQELVVPVKRGCFEPLDVGYGPRTQPDGTSQASSGFERATKREPEDVRFLEADASQEQKTVFLRSWWQEISSAMFSLACIVAIIVILDKIDAKMLSSWHIALSPNAVISILIVAAKAAMIQPVAESLSQLKWLWLHSSKLQLEQLQVYDKASRGPTGALKFMFRARRASAVAYFGCVIVIIAIALEPFTQQILEYKSIGTSIPHQNSSVSHSLLYDQWLYTDTSANNMISEYRDQTVVAGGLSGLYGVVPNPPFTCPGANCTFPVTTTLGICSVCEDVTAQTQATCNNNETAGEMASGIYNYCVYDLPGGSEFNATATFSPHTGFVTPTMNISVNESSSTYTNIVTLGLIRFDTNSSQSAGPSAEWQSTMAAYQCSLELCAYAFENWTYASGVLVPGSTLYSPLNHTAGEEVVYTMSLLDYQALDPDFPDANATTYSINNLDKNGLLQNFEVLFGTDYIADSLYQSSTNITASLDDFATGMTYNMMSGPNATLALGLALENMTYIHVRWPWLTLCVSMVVFSAFFLVFTIFKTQKAEIRAWKSSLEPLVFADSNMRRHDSAYIDRERVWSEEHKSQRIMSIKEILR